MPHIFSYIKNILINFLPLLTTLFIGVLCLILLSKIIYFYQKRSIVHSKVAGQLLQFLYCSVHDQHRFLWTAIRGFISEFGLFPWRVLSAQTSPFQALITITKTAENSGARK